MMAMSDAPIVRQERLPASEEVTEVAPGVLRLQLPIALPGLAHINTYAILDDRGVAIVDPGLPGKPSWGHLLDRMKKADVAMLRVLASRPLRQRDAIV
jgi:glyoxylase-like metal-dependent hydrolase (beta-lactamase superfamily II)